MSWETSIFSVTLHMYKLNEVYMKDLKCMENYGIHASLVTSLTLEL